MSALRKNDVRSLPPNELGSLQPLNCGRCLADALPSKPVNPLTVERITRAALAIVEESGYPGVSMCTVADRLDTGQVSLPEHPVSG